MINWRDFRKIYETAPEELRPEIARCAIRLLRWCGMRTLVRNKVCAPPHAICTTPSSRGTLRGVASSIRNASNIKVIQLIDYTIQCVCVFSMTSPESDPCPRRPKSPFPHVYAEYVCALIDIHRMPPVRRTDRLMSKASMSDDLKSTHQTIATCISWTVFFVFSFFL